MNVKQALALDTRWYLTFSRRDDGTFYAERAEAATRVTLRREYAALGCELPQIGGDR